MINMPPGRPLRWADQVRREALNALAGRTNVRDLWAITVDVIRVLGDPDNAREHAGTVRGVLEKLESEGHVHRADVRGDKWRAGPRPRPVEASQETSHSGRSETNEPGQKAHRDASVVGSGLSSGLKLPPRPADEVAGAIWDLLQDGPRPAGEVIAAVLARTGCSKATCKRRARDLVVRMREGFPATLWWRLSPLVAGATSGAAGEGRDG